MQPENVIIKITVNGKHFERSVEPRRLLSDFLRQDIFLTGTHVGCEHGICGSCSVLLDGKSTRSCLTFAVMADGCEIETIEGLGDAQNMHPLQEGFWQKHGLQCGFCTPGVLMVALELLRENPSPTRAEIREALAGNLCRCTGYQTIVDSIEKAAEIMREGAAQ